MSKPLRYSHEHSLDRFGTALGWFSLGLAAAEVLAPHLVTKPLGMKGQEKLVRAYGLRELAAGAGILVNSGPRRAPWMWSRVAGDLLDIATVAGLPADSRKRRNRKATVVALAGVTLLDTFCAQAYSDRGSPSHGGRTDDRRALRSPGYIRYANSVETIAPDEDKLFEKIAQVMAGGGEMIRKREGRALRSSHAKPFGLLRGELQVMDGLPPELRQGLFANPRSYPVAVRMAQVPAEPLDDRRVSTPRGMAIKVLDVDGEMLPGHAGDRTQDFVLDTGKAFISSSARTFLAAITGTEAATPLPEGAKAAVSTGARAANAALNAVGLNSAKLDFYGHPFRHPLAEEYYSQCAFRYGDFIAKLGVFPARRMVDDRLDPAGENGLRTAMSDYFRDRAAEFIIAIQLCTDLDRMPVEDAAVEWPESESPYRAVARLILPSQPAFNAERESAIDEDLSFCPAHSLAAHRPLGSVMRARMRVYEELGRKRRELNGRPVTEPRA